MDSLFGNWNPRVDGGKAEENENRPLIQPTASRKEGKYPDIFTFMQEPSKRGSGCQLIPRPTGEIYDLNANPAGKIIYIRDHELSPLHDRVMVVLRLRPSSYTCLTFCFHEIPEERSDHWSVSKPQEQHRRSSNEDYNVLEVVLRPYSTEGEIAPKPNITTNIQDVWNVEKEVSVVILGHVHPISMKRLIEQHKRLYCQSLDAAVPGGAHSARGGEAADSRRRRRSGW